MGGGVCQADELKAWAGQTEGGHDFGGVLWRGNNSFCVTCRITTEKLIYHMQIKINIIHNKKKWWLVLRLNLIQLGNYDGTLIKYVDLVYMNWKIIIIMYIVIIK